MAGLLRLVSIVASVLVLLGFGGFVADEASSGSRQQVQRLDDGSPGAEQAREHAHGKVREVIDDANDYLLYPFRHAAGTRDPWPQHIAETVLALLVWGFGLSFLANLLPRRGHRPRDWREVGTNH